MNYLLSRAEMGTAGPRNQESRILCPLAFLRKCGGGGGGGGGGGARVAKRYDHYWSCTIESHQISQPKCKSLKMQRKIKMSRVIVYWWKSNPYKFNPCYISGQN